MYLSREYETMMYAVEQTKVLSALKKPNANYAFYIPSDRSIGLSGDSSLRRVVDDRELNLYHFESWDMANRRWVYVNENNLRKKILNQIAVRPPKGNADKEFIRNLGGNFIEVNNDEGTVEGSRPSTFGRNGSKVLKVEPEPLYPGEPDNGEIYKVNTWFNYLKGRDYYGMFLSNYPEFFDLLKKAGLYNPSYYNFPFLIDGEYYTVFIPSSQALEDYQVDTLSKPELRKFIKYHFVRGDLIFTDGSKPAGKYTTSRQDESSAEYMTKYSQLNIRPKPDVIEILDKNGQVYLEIPQQEGETNQMVTYDTNEGSTSKWDYITTGVIHNIDKVLIKDSLQAK
jgi:hypothetical protein